MELDEDDAENDAPLILYDDLIDVGNRRGFLLPGDLVELRYFPATIFPVVILSI